jgi:hypothetical protein
MKIYLNGTANLGDFLNGLPVLSGINKSYGKFDLIIRHEMKKFKGLIEFLVYQDIFNSVEFDADLFFSGATQMSSWPIREDKGDPNRQIEVVARNRTKHDFFHEETFHLRTELYAPIDEC